MKIDMFPYGSESTRLIDFVPNSLLLLAYLCMYPVFRRLDVLSAMQDYPAASLCALYHVALKKEAVRQVIIRQDDALIVVPVKVLVQKLPQFVPKDKIFHYGLEIFPTVKL